MRFPAITVQTIATPRMVYLMGADVRLSANDEPDAFAADRVEATQAVEDVEQQVHQLRCAGVL